MQPQISEGSKTVAAHRPGVRVMLLTDRPHGPTALRLASYGSLIDIEPTLEKARAAILEDALGYDLFVMDCDGFGGLEGAERALASLIASGARIRVMLVCGGFDEPAYPLGRRTAVCLPSAEDEDAFRRGFDHVLRDRAAVTLM